MTTVDELKGLIHENFGIEAAELNPARPLSEYGLDSLSLAELVFTVEKHFGIEVPDLGEEVRTLCGLAGVIDNLRTQQAA